jgi:glycosyltransferase involved in cell wall biosynthesis
MAGGYRIAIELIRRWSSRTDLTFHIYTTKDGQKMIKRYITQNKKIVYDLIWSPTFLTKLCLNHALISIVLYIFLFLYGSIEALISDKKESTVLVYSVTPFLPDLIPGLLMKLRTRSIKWFVAHAMFAPNPLTRGFGIPKRLRIPSLRDMGFYLNEKLTYPLFKKFADFISETNDLDRKRCIREGFSPERVLVIKGGVDIKLSQTIPEPKEKKYDAVFIGRLHPQKGLLELIDIWRFVCEKRSDAGLVIIGNGPLEKDIEIKIRKHGLEKNIILFGFKDGIEKIRIFKNSKIVLHPAIYDSGGMAACEAMACGLPGVSFDLPALKTYYPKGMLKTPCFDLKAFAENIQRLLEDQELYGKLQKEALELAREWDWDRRATYLLDKVIEASK